MLFVAVIFTALAVSYGWGMRGCVIGGEKGALLPGALLGLCLAFFMCDGEFSYLYLFFAAVGALSTFYGGTETYGQTMGFVLHPEREGYQNKFHIGIIGVFLKGGLWFSIAGGMLSLLIGTLSGEYYSATEYTVLFLLIPVFTLIGPKIFNSPYDKENKRFPKIYFSLDRAEEWGGNVLLTLAIVILAAVNKDILTLGAVLTGFVSGGTGFAGGLILFRLANHGTKKRQFFRKLNELHMIEGWKLMEHIFGAVAGGCLMLYFGLNSDKISQLLSKTDLSALPLSGDRDIIAGAATVLMLFLSALLYAVRAFNEKKGRRYDERTYEMFERPLWSAFPLILIFMGSESAAADSAFVTVCYALCEKCGVEWFKGRKNEKTMRILCFILFILSFSYFLSCLVTGRKISTAMLIILYTFMYTLPCIPHFFTSQRKKERKEKKMSILRFYSGGGLVVWNFIAQSIIITLFVCFYFQN